MSSSGNVWFYLASPVMSLPVLTCPRSKSDALVCWAPARPLWKVGLFTGGWSWARACGDVIVLSEAMRSSWQVLKPLKCLGQLSVKPFDVFYFFSFVLSCSLDVKMRFESVFFSPDIPFLTFFCWGPFIQRPWPSRWSQSCNSHLFLTPTV